MNDKILEYKNWFQANLLDGDDINDCGKAMLDAKDVFETTSDYLSLQSQQTKGELREAVEILEKYRCGKHKKLHKALTDILSLLKEEHGTCTNCGKPKEGELADWCGKCLAEE